MHDVPYVVFSGLAVIFNIVPLIWQAAHNNSGPICLGVWIIIANLNRFVGASRLEYITITRFTG
jgi:hypothetical protein